MKIKVISANEWVYPDIFEYATASDSIDVHAPRGSWAGVQLLVPGTRPGDPIEVCCDGNLEPEIYRMLDVQVERNTGKDGNWAALQPGTPKPDYCTRQAPFWVFDILQPMDDGGNVVEKETTAFYICWKTPRDLTPGVYGGKVTVKIGDESGEVPFKVMVHKAQLPEESRVSMLNQFQNNISRIYGLKPWSEEWVAMLRKFYRMLRRAGNTHVITPLGKVVSEENGRYTFDFSESERYARIAFEEGFEGLELGYLCCKNYVETEKYWLFYAPQGRKIPASSPEGYRFLAQYLPAWRDFLKERGWYDKSVQHVGDEPTAPEADDFRIICGIVHKFMPGMKLLDAVCHTELAGSVDCWLPANREYQLNKEIFDEMRELGDEMWFYTCCNPGGKWLNRFLDGELLRPRLLHYGNYRFKLKGYLHWGFNAYQGPMEQIRVQSCWPTDSKRNFWPAGDCHITYPGPNGPWMSLRAEMIRSGVEDANLLYMISDSNPALADTLCTNVMQSFNEYETDVVAFEANYRKILEAADML